MAELDPADPYYADLLPTFQRLVTLTQLAARTRRINEACGSAMSPREIAAQWPEEDAELIDVWMEHPRA